MQRTVLLLSKLRFFVVVGPSPVGPAYQVAAVMKRRGLHRANRVDEREYRGFVVIGSGDGGNCSGRAVMQRGGT